MRLPRSIKRASLGPEGPGSVLCRARGHRLAGQRPGWPVVSQKSMPRGRRGCGLLDIATHGGSRPGQAALTEKFQGHSPFPAERVQGFLSQGSSSVNLWGCPSGGRCSPGILGSTCHLGRGIAAGGCLWREPLSVTMAIPSVSALLPAAGQEPRLVRSAG